VEQIIQELLKTGPDLEAIESSGYFISIIRSCSIFEKYGFKGAIAEPYEKSSLKEALEKLFE
jgi:hypothetical protein